MGVLLLSSCENNPSTSTPTINSEKMETNETGFDADLALELGADEYGMRSYVMAFLKRGPNRERSEEEAIALQRAHLDNISRLAEEGLLSIAGPFLDDGELRGIYIFNVSTIEEAEALTKTDPAIQQGQLIMELRPWYGSAALMKVSELHKSISAKSI